MQPVSQRPVWSYDRVVHRTKLYRVIQERLADVGIHVKTYGDKLPLDLGISLLSVEVPSRDPDRPLGVFAVTILPTTFVRRMNFMGTGSAHSTREHRVLLRCSCNRMVPAGRIAQHRCRPLDATEACEGSVQ